MLPTPCRLLLAALLLVVVTACGGGGGGGGGNQAPVAAFSTTTSDGSLQVSFDGRASSDSDGSIVSYQWSFGDGTSGSGAQLNHSYLQAGSYTATLTVTDDDGASATTSRLITVTAPPRLTLAGTISAPEDNVIDGDTNDPLSSETANNDLDSAQPLPNPAAVGGYVTTLGTGISGDRFEERADGSDFYSVSLLAGQPLLLEISDWGSASVDLDLALYDSVGTLIASAEGVNDTELLLAPATGDYYVEVYGWSGGSNYLLTIGQSSAAVTAAMAKARATTQQPFVAGELLVAFNGAMVMSESGLLAQARSLGLAAERASAGRAVKVSFDSGRMMARRSESQVTTQLAAQQATLRMAKKLATHPSVAAVAPNFLFQPTATTPNDPLYPEQWHYPAINLPQAWDLATGSGAIVAVVDTGVYLAHPDLAANLTSGYDFISDLDNALDGNGIDSNPDDPGDGGSGGGSSWHGTHVAGTIAAVSNNNLGIAGIAWNAQVMPLRALGAWGGTSYDIQQAVYYAAGLDNDSGTRPTPRADVINLSLGCLACYSALDQQAYTAARNAGVIVVAAAGNEATAEPAYPASYDGVISVSAVNRQDRLANYSNYGPTIDVAAPGGEQSAVWTNGVLSTLVDESSGSRRASYEYYQGTSMATPHLAGVLALMVERYPALSPADVDNALASGAIVDDLGTPGHDHQFGHGRINALKAVQHATALAGGTVESQLLATPGAIDLGRTTTTATITLSRSGTTAITLATLSDDADWLTLAASDVDDSGLGDYQLSVERSGLADGPYQATITFTADNGSQAVVRVNMRVGNAQASSGVGHLYLLLLDHNFATLDQQQLNADTNGQYAFSFDDLAAGSYYLLAGTDSDNDFSLCDAGEACGAYPTRGLSTPVLLTTDRSDADFVVLFGSSFDSGTPAAPLRHSP